MNALSGVRRIWSGSIAVPEPRPTPPTGPRLRAVGGRIGLVEAAPAAPPSREADEVGADAARGDY